MSNYTQMPNQPPYPAPNQAGYPPANQGYPPANQGYPPANQGYPPSGPGYPPGAQGQPPSGYPPQGQGYPPQGQGYPPQGQGYQAPPPQMGQPGDMTASVEPSAPPPEVPQNLPGYSNIGFEDAFLPPPGYEDVVREPPSRDSISGSAALSHGEAKEALMGFVSENCCYGSGPIDHISFTDMQSSSAFHYILESFCESRSSKWESEPYKGQAVVVTGPPPGPWELSVPVPQMFKDAKLKVEVPNSAYVKPCHTCAALGYKRCRMCHGMGRVTCNFCNGNGTRADGMGERSQCSACNGMGRQSCSSCSGSGQIRCSTCRGHCQLRWFIQLTVKWNNHHDDYVVERTELPGKLIKGVSGTTALKETALRVWPINHFPDQEVNTASAQLVAAHSTKFPTERMLQQQHSVRIVPVTNVSYTYKHKMGSFFVYGLENKVYFPDYPAKCCCGCSIL